MNQPKVANSVSNFPYLLLTIVLVICAFPIILNMFGLDFQSNQYYFNVEQITNWQLSYPLLLDEMYYALEGGVTHGILEWTAVVVAFATAALALVHFRVAKDVVSPIIGMALLCSATLSAFHALATMRLIEAIAKNSELIPFTWIVSQIFTATILITGAILCLTLNLKYSKKALYSVLFVSLLFGFVSYLIISYTANLESLPLSLDNRSSFFTQIFDLIPFSLFLIAIPIFFLLYKKHPNFITASLLISLLPQIELELYIVFGSTRLFDNADNIAHFLKIVSYSVIFTGFVLDYISTYIQEQIFAKQLAHSNKELDDFAYIASHDLKEPLRAIGNHCSFLKEDYEDQLDEQGVKRINRLIALTGKMANLVDDLLYFSRIGRSELNPQEIDFKELIEDVEENLKDTFEEKNVKIQIPGPFPKVKCDRVRIREAVHNLISNAIKYNDKEEKVIELGYVPKKKKDKVTMEDVFYVKDNGIGIHEDFKEDVFRIFKRLNSEKEYGGGTGAGLTFVKKIIDQHHGDIWLESQPGEGSTFYFTLEGEKL